MSKKSALFIVESGKEWIGGVHYVKNILKTLSYAAWFCDWEVHVLVKSEFLSLFNSLKSSIPQCIVHQKRDNKPSWERMVSLCMRPFGRTYDLQVADLVERHNIRLIFPVTSLPFQGIASKQIYWFPDFQHHYMPQLFSRNELKQRDKRERLAVAENRPLILSSCGALADWNVFAPRHHGDVYVLPFIADIEAELGALTPEQERSHLEASGLWEGDMALSYFYVPNQFWKHKNHILVLEALELIQSKGRPVPLVVCTGNISGYHTHEYVDKLLNRVKKSGLQERFRFLSLVERARQLSIMKNARAVIQPSLFEGWNTGIQEAKRLGKRLMMSDLPIHREQSPHGARFFDPNSALQLSMLLEENMDMQTESDHVLKRNNENAARVYAEGVAELFVQPRA